MADWRSSAAYRIAFAYAAAFSVGIALLGVAIFYGMHARFVQELDASLTEEATSLQEENRTGGRGELAEAITKREAVDTRDLSEYGLFDPTGKRLAGHIPGAPPPLGFHDIPLPDHAGNPDAARSLGIRLGDGQRLVVATDLEPVEQIDRTVLKIFGFGFAGVVLIGILAALVLGNYLRRRLQTMSTSAETIIAGNISHRMPVGPRDDEFDQLAGTLNAMLERIESLLDNLRQVSGDIAHDLRTPLTRLRTQLEGGQKALTTAAAGPDVIGRAIHQVDEILALFAAILRISEIESGHIAQRFKPADLSELVSEISESYAPAIEEQGRALQWQVEPGVVALVDRELVAQALVNLIENGQRHTPPGSLLTISLKQSGENALLTVTDNGPGVVAADWPKIVRRFVRLDRSRGNSGHGLGLNLVAAVARLHNGSLEFGDNEPGLIAQISIPAIERPSKPD